MSFFLLHRPMLGIAFQCVIVIGLPRLSSVVTAPLSPLVFMTLTPLKSPSQVFSQNDPQLDVMFLEIRRELWVWAWGTSEMKCLFHSVMTDGHCYQDDLSLVTSP